MNKQTGYRLAKTFGLLALAGSTSLAQAQRQQDWCNGEAWYNSAFGSRHYQYYQGRTVHANSIAPVYREMNPGAGVTCYRKDSHFSYSFGWYPNSNPDRTELNHTLREMRSHTSYAGIGYEFARPRLGGITVAPGVFAAVFTGYPKLETKGLGGLALIPGFTLSARGEKFGFEAKIITDPFADKKDRKTIIGMSWMMRF
jgi:hypothetical protein